MADDEQPTDAVSESTTGDNDDDVRGDGGVPEHVAQTLANGPLGLPVRRERILLWLAAVVLFLAVAYVAWRYVGTVVLGVFAYYVTRPVFDRIRRRIESRTLAVVVALGTVALPVLVLVGWTVYVALRSLGDVVASDLGDQITTVLQPYADLTTIAVDVTTTFQAILADPTRLTELNLGGVLSQSFALLTAVVGELFAVGLHAFIVLIIVFYLLRDDYRIARWARGTFVTGGGVVDGFLVAVDRDLKNVFFGNILNALLTSFLAVVTYLLLNAVAPSLVRIPEPALVGLLVGAASLVPVIGIKLVTVPVALYLLGRAAVFAPEALWFPVVFIAVSFVVVDYIPDQLLRPYVSGRSLHIGAVMLAYTLGPILFGWYGIFLGPMILVVVFEFTRKVVPWLANPRTSVGDTRDEASDEADEQSPSVADVEAEMPDGPARGHSVPPDDASDGGGT